jgi:pimeloyl-ACP methyl ester carboxylesterase
MAWWTAVMKVRDHRRVRTVRAAEPAETGNTAGLAWARFAPAHPEAGARSAGVVILHGAGSEKESHLDFARACAASGLAALAFDARGHGESDGPMDGRAVEDVAAMADVLRERGGVERLALRGSSMGGYLAIVAAAGARADAVVAICPASGEGLLRGLRAGRFPFSVDAASLEPVLASHDVMAAAAELDAPLLLLHAEGDETVPVAHSRALHAAAPGSRLIAVPGGHHRSVQHDPELQGEAIRWLRKRLLR